MTVKITELPLAASVAGSTIMYVIDPTGPTSERTTLESIADVISPTASQSVKGIVTIGTGINVDVNGVISVPTVTTISGNAGTVTNGVYTTGSYADPTWITSLAASKVGLGSVTNESKATMFASPTFTGTVSGVTATMVGLGSVTNESKVTMFSSPTFTGTVTIPAGASISGYATSSGATISGASISNAVGMNFASGVLVSGFSDDGTFASNASNKVPVESAVKTYVDTGLALKANLASPTFTGTVAGVTKAHVGLGNVTNESKATMFTSPTFTEVPLAPTAIAGTNTTQVATTQFVRTEVSNLVNGAGPALDTLKELADALGSDANFSTTISTALGLKAPLASPAFTGTVTGVTATMVGLGNVANESKATMFASPTFTGTVSGVTATHVGLGNVTNESKATMFASPTFTGTANLSTATASTSTTTGALTVAGGVGIAGNLYVGGNTIGISSCLIQSGTANNISFKTGVAASSGASISVVGSDNNSLGFMTFTTSGTTFSGTVAGTNLSGTNTGDQTLPTLASLGAAPTASPTFTGTVSGVTATHVGLGNVTNESKATMFTNPAIKQTAGAGGITLTSEGGWPAGIQFKSSGGTFDAPTQTGNNYNVLNISAQGHIGSGGTGGFTTLGWMEWMATEAITASNRGSQLSLYANKAGGSASYGLFWNGDTFDTTQGKIKATGITTGGSTTAGTLTGAWTLTGSISGVTATMVGLGSVTNESKATMFASPTFTGTVSGVTKAHVGLGSVDNTADANKAVSSASTAGTATNHYGAGGSYIASSNSGTSYGSAIQVREAGLGGSQGGAIAYAPRLAFHWSGLVASSIVMESSGRIAIVNNPGTAYEAFVCGTLTASNFSGTSSGTNTGDQTIPTTLPASDVYAWAKAATKPSYTATEVGLSNVGNYTVNQNVGTANDVTFNTVTATAFYYSSDATLKTNIGTLTNYWETLDALRPVSFDWISSGKKDLGLLAQDVQSVMPESVTTTDAGTLAISSSGIIANLVAAVKDLKRQVEELTKQLKG
jgi:hypothetical protein